MVHYYFLLSESGPSMGTTNFCFLTQIWCSNDLIWTIWIAFWSPFYWSSCLWANNTLPGNVIIFGIIPRTTFSLLFVLSAYTPTPSWPSSWTWNNCLFLSPATCPVTESKIYHHSVLALCDFAYPRWQLFYRYYSFIVMIPIDVLLFRFGLFHFGLFLV